MSYNKAYFQEALDFIHSKTDMVPEMALILGSGLATLVTQLENTVTISYKDIPGFLQTTNPAHKGELIFGLLNGKKVVCMVGRFHSYEGFSFPELVIPVRLLKLLGIHTLITTNAAGAVNLDYKPGDVMMIKDHLFFGIESPMKGLNEEEFGPRFYDVSKLYTPELREKAKEVASHSNLTFHEGNYFFMQGPHFETPAEIRAIRILGGDTVGMSTVTETLTAGHCGLKVLSFSVCTNMAAGILGQPLSDEEVNEVGKKIAKDFAAYMRELVGEL
ncbi:MULTISPECIES: purine-nucleoside phosphorylase [Terrabacteria group]|uniref:purine-nucleoside phosphorylase n=1 Tax=Bacillati TaxID=1783272 RepID=UPI001C6E5AEF|nr:MULTISPECIES: purine-nucleoside phosphorylase [Terrabacteria group]MBW9212706.1 purine-nucleoside phosphorylase [Trueperella sp. zg.1013]